MVDASKDCDIDAFKDVSLLHSVVFCTLTIQAMAKYVKAVPGTSYGEMEYAFRQQDLNVYLIALVSPHG